MAIKILFHSYGSKHCPDGFAAAYAAWLHYWNEAKYIPCEYQKPAPVIEPGDSVYILDFSYPKDVLLKMSEIANKIVVLDHHKTAKEDLLGLNFAIFDMKKSGAELAWEYWHKEPAPDLIRYVGDRDLWRKSLPHSEEIHRALSSFPQDFEVWDTLANLPNYVDFMYRIGKPIYDKFNEEVEELILTAEVRELAGYHILSTTTSNYSLVSDALNRICDRNSSTAFAANARESSDGKIKFELRSVGSFDVSAIAKQFGGGGHLNAAGFTTDKDDERIKDFV